MSGKHWIDIYVEVTTDRPRELTAALGHLLGLADEVIEAQVIVDGAEVEVQR